MKVLIVASYTRGRFAPFITDQVEALRRAGVVCKYFGIEKKGIRGYLSEFGRLKKEISSFGPDVIHAHYGLSGLLANLQREVPVVTTYHGSDINDSGVFRFSRLSIALSAFNVFVSQKNVDKAGVRSRFALIPCGVDMDVFRQIPRRDARQSLGWGDKERVVLFAGTFDNPVKNAHLARSAVALLDGVRLAELKGLGRDEVAMWMNAADALLMTSLSEGSPQVVKEAMACGCPVVSVDVGDVAEVMSGVDGCYIASRDADSIAAAIRKAVKSSGEHSGRNRIESTGLSNDKVALRIAGVYRYVIGVDSND